MDVSSKDFALNFRGFEQSDPETVKRFIAFCEANFAVSPDLFMPSRTNPLTVVLAQGESSEELEALAKVLREIGARVDVSEKCHIEEGATIQGPSTQDLHRFFEHHQEEGRNEAFQRYPTLGRSLYLLTQSEGVFDRRQLRSGRETRQETPPSPLRWKNSLAIPGLISLLVGMIALVALVSFDTRAPSSASDKRGHSSSFPSRAQTEFTRSDVTLKDGTPPKTLSANATLSGFNVTLKVLASPGTLSISSLTVTPLSEGALRDGTVLRRALGEPTFLSESSSGDWKGSILLSVFLEKYGQEFHVTVPARVTARVNTDLTEGRAFIEIDDAQAPGSSNAFTARHVGATALLSALRMTDLPLSR